MRRLLPWLAAALTMLGACEVSTTSAEIDRAPLDSMLHTAEVTLRLRSVGPADAERTTVVVHGGPGLSADAMVAYDSLASTDRRVVSWDQRATGRSEEPRDGDLSLAGHVADLDAIRAAIGAEAVDLVGQSWGGAIAAAYAAIHPDRVSSLALVGAVPLDVEAFLAGQERFRERIAIEQRAGTVPDPLPAPAEGSCLDTFSALLPVYLHDDDVADRVSVGTCTASASSRTYDAFVADPAVSRLAGQLSRYRGPVLLVTGRDDAFGLGWIDRIAELLEGASVSELVVDDAGHLVVAEAPDVVLAGIAALDERP